MTYCFLLARRLSKKGIIIGAFIEKESGRVVEIEGHVAHAAYPEKLKAIDIEILQGQKKSEFLDKFDLCQSPYTGVVQPRASMVLLKGRVEIPVMQLPAPKPGDPCPVCGGSGMQSMITTRKGEIRKKNSCPECEGTGKIS